MTEKLLMLGCAQHRDFPSEKLDEFAQDLIELCKKHDVTINGISDVSPSLNPFMDHTWDVRGLVLGKLKDALALQVHQLDEVGKKPR